MAVFRGGLAAESREQNQFAPGAEALHFGFFRAE